MKRKQAQRGIVSVNWRAPSGLDHHWETEIVKRNGYVGRKSDQDTDVTEVSHLFRQTVIFFPLKKKKRKKGRKKKKKLGCFVYPEEN